jgi:DNA polymerase-3 subunit delta'
MAWDSVIGHDDVKRRLQEHIKTGRVPNAYLLAGPEGVGKRMLALEMAKALNCQRAPDGPCDACALCRQIGKASHPDLHLLSPSGASDQIRIDDVRSLLGRIALRPYNARFQAAILDGADRLTEEAANSVLKALEEPPATTRFILIASRLAECLPTIVSRCQVLRCGPLPDAAVRRILETQHGCDAAMAHSVAPLAGGSVSMALRLIDRWQPRQAAINRLSSAGGQAWFDPLPDTRDGVAELLDGMMEWVRDVAVTASASPLPLRHPGHQHALARQAAQADPERCAALAMELAQLRESLAQFTSPKVVAALAREKWLDLMAPAAGIR